MISNTSMTALRQAGDAVTTRRRLVKLNQDIVASVYDPLQFHDT
jgi:hypothetical protein